MASTAAAAARSDAVAFWRSPETQLARLCAVLIAVVWLGSLVVRPHPAVVAPLRVVPGGGAAPSSGAGLAGPASAVKVASGRPHQAKVDLWPVPPEWCVAAISVARSSALGRRLTPLELRPSVRPGASSVPPTGRPSACSGKCAGFSPCSPGRTADRLFFGRRTTTWRRCATCSSASTACRRARPRVGRSSSSRPRPCALPVLFSLPRVTHQRC